jgi:APA family basic amino acid/polyamine antiporter
MAEYDKLFTRKATGLVRSIGITTAVLIAICNVVGLGWQKRVFQATGWSPLGESKFFLGIHPMVMAFLLTGILILMSIFCFAMLAAAMPKSGGGYIFISRILSPGLGFTATWLQFWAVAVSYGMIAVAVMEAVFIFGNLAGIATPVWLTPWVKFAAGAGIIGLFSGFACLGIKQTGRLLHSIFWLPAGMMVVIYFLFLRANPTTMATGVQNLFGHSAVEYINAAIAQGMGQVAATNTYWRAVGSALLAAYWAYIGYAAATFVAGEVKEAHRTLPKAMFISGAVIIGLYMSITVLMSRAASMVGKVGDLSFLPAVAYLNFGEGSFAAAGLPQVGGWMPVMAAIQASGMGLGAWFMLILVIFAALWVANDIPPFILTSSRMIFAMAFDRVLPRRLSNVNERWHSPINAIIFVSLVSLVGAAAEADIFVRWPQSIAHAIINPSGAIGATDMWDAIFFTFCAVAAIYFPIRKTGIFEKSPFRASKTFVITIGTMAAAGNAWLLWVIAADPHGWNLLNITGFRSALPFIFSVFLIAVGIGIYTFYNRRAKTTGVELTTIFTEIPPD